MKNTKKSGFTLSEALLAMTIVGAVAILTIPTLGYTRTKKEYSAKLKHFYSRIENAIMDTELENGSLKSTAVPKDLYTWYIDYITPFFGYQMTNGTDTIYFRDGSSAIFDNKTSGNCVGLIYDLNADKAPNSTGRDRYRFYFCFGSNITARKSTIGTDSFFGAPATEEERESSRATLVSSCRNNTDKCTLLLERDQWTYMNDYPHKF